MSSSRKVVFANGEYYHVFNRGVEKRPTFTNKFEFKRAVATANYYKYKNVPVKYSQFLTLQKKEKIDLLSMLDDVRLQVSIIAFCFMENHFHFLLKQLNENGIVNFMAKFTNSYTKYFNTKHQRVGPLFQGVFKAVHVNTDEQLIHLSRYIHLNPVTGFVINLNELPEYRWSSYPEYVNKSDLEIADKKEIMVFFNNSDAYAKFIQDQSDYARQLKLIEHLSIE